MLTGRNIVNRTDPPPQPNPTQEKNLTETQVRTPLRRFEKDFRTETTEVYTLPLTVVCPPSGHDGQSWISTHIMGSTYTPANLADQILALCKQEPY
jgi:hypothetical protein